MLKLNVYFRYQGKKEEPHNGLGTEGAKDEQTNIEKENDLEKADSDKKDKDELDEKPAIAKSGMCHEYL